MGHLSSHDITMMLLAVGVLLTVARVMGELARAINQPMVLGEILAGLLLGPTVLGTLAPELTGALFPAQGKTAEFLAGISTLAVSLFMLVAGMELDLSTVWRQGKTAITVGIMGIVIPFVVGFTAAMIAPRLMGREPAADGMIFSLFIATALSISALPVIAKTLFDLNLSRSDLGMLVLAAAIFNDLFGWIIFAIILSLMGTKPDSRFDIGATIWLTLGFAALMLTFGRWLFHRMLPWIQAYTSWPGGVIGFALSLAILGAAFTEWIGVHAVFGAFLVGVAIGDSTHLREQTRNIINQFVSFVFAPLFFASIGLQLNFLAHFDPLLTLFVLVIACLGKVLGCGLGARLSGMPRREAWAVGFGLNARGAMEIILGLLALQYGVISERLFVALVIMALVTSIMSGPMMQYLLKNERPRRFIDFLSARAFIHRLKATERRQAIVELAQAAAGAAGLEPEVVERAVWLREEMMATGLEHGIAVPHARLGKLTGPATALGLSEQGIDFDSPDGKPARIICLILTPETDNGAQLEILADIARTFGREEMRQQTLNAANHTQFLAVIKSEPAKA